MPLIQIENLRKSFGASEILKGISLPIEEGEFVTLLGASGCGKSTLLRILAGLERADSGQLIYNGTPFDAPGAGQFVPTQKRQFGFVFQDHALWPHLSLDENIAFPLRSYGWAKSDIARRVRDVLHSVQMAEHAGKYPRQLSGGQRQRVGIARALALSPRVILLDEPLASLDSNLRDELGHEIRKLAKEFGLTCINVTHDRREAQILSDRIAVMSAGQIQQVGAPLEIFTQPRTVETARFLNAGNILPGALLGRNHAHILLPRNAVELPETGSPHDGSQGSHHGGHHDGLRADLVDMIFIDGRFEITAKAQGHSLTFYADQPPTGTNQLHLAFRGDLIVPLEG